METTSQERVTDMPLALRPMAPGSAAKPTFAGRFRWWRHEYAAITVLLIVGGLAAVLAAPSRSLPTAGKASAGGQAAHEQSPAVIVRAPLPAGMSEGDIPKWVPLRRPSGRTELAPWSSVDGYLAQDPDVLDRLLNPAPASPPEPAPEQTEEIPPAAAGGSGTQAGQSATGSTPVTPEGPVAPHPARR